MLYSERQPPTSLCQLRPLTPPQQQCSVPAFTMGPDVVHNGRTLRSCVVSALDSNKLALKSSPLDDSSELWRLERAAATSTGLSQPQEALDLRAGH